MLSFLKKRALYEKKIESTIALTTNCQYKSDDEINIHNSMELLKQVFKYEIPPSVVRSFDGIVLYN